MEDRLDDQILRDEIKDEYLTDSTSEAIKRSIRDGKVGNVDLLLTDPDLDINALGDSYSILQYAVVLPGQTQQSTDAQDRYRKSVLRENYIEVLKLILSHPNIDVNLRSKMGGWTALHFAAYKSDESGFQSPRAVKLLLEYGADPTIKDDNGATPRDIAIIQQKKKNGPLLIVRALEEAEARRQRLDVVKTTSSLTPASPALKL